MKSDMKMVRLLGLLRRILSLLCLLIAGLAPVSAFAAGVEDHRPILQIDVKDAASGRTRIELWSLEELCDLPLKDLQTSTPWTEGTQDFSGVPVEVLLDQLGVTEGKVELWATNDYSVATSVEKLRESKALLAFRRNGEFMSPRGKGPLWMMFAFDDTPALRTESIYSLSVWQLDRIRISR